MTDRHQPESDHDPGSPHRRALWSRPGRIAVYPRREEHARARRATDLVLLVLCCAGIVALAQVSDPPSGIEQALVGLAQAVPDFLDVLWAVGSGLVVAWAAVLVLAAAGRGLWPIARDQVLAVAGTVGVVALSGTLTAPGTRNLWDAFTATGPPAEPVSIRIAVAAATTVVASPHLARPFRAAGRWLVAFGALSLVILEATTPSGALLGVLCGAAAATTVHLLLGSSAGRPTLADIQRGLAELGIEATRLSVGERQRAGAYLVDAVDEEGDELVVKVFGRDAWDAQLVTKAWRALWYRDADALTLTRVQQAEHEAFVTLLAARSGVPVDDVLGAGRTTSHDALLVLRRRGTPLERGLEGVDAAVVDAVWDMVLSLGDAGFAHGDLGPATLRLDGREVVVHGLAGATVAASDDQRRMDLAQILVTTTLLTDADRAVDAASDRLGADRLAEVLPYLQVAALGPQLREAIADAGLDLDALRTRAATEAGVDEPELARVRRLSAAVLARTALIIAAAYFLISAFAGVDLDQLLDVLKQASPAVLLVALVAGQVPRVPQAEATRGACPRPIPFGPVLLLQFAISFVNLAIPATAARVAVNVRFFQRLGIPPASAMSIGVIDSLGGFAGQLIVLTAVLLFGFGDVHFDLSQLETQDGSLVQVLLVVAAVVVALAALAAVVPKARNWVLDRVRPWWQEALETVANLRSPSKVARVIGFNLVAEFLFACTLGIVLAALGTSLPIATLMVINVTVGLFAGLMPIPGGIGVSEGALTVGLTAAGLDEATAFAAAICYRLCTYYLPPIWGSVAFRRLERNGYL